MRSTIVLCDQCQANAHTHTYTFTYTSPYQRDRVPSVAMRRQKTIRLNSQQRENGEEEAVEAKMRQEVFALGVTLHCL